MTFGSSAFSGSASPSCPKGVDTCVGLAWVELILGDGNVRKVGVRPPIGSVSRRLSVLMLYCLQKQDKTSHECKGKFGPREIRMKRKEAKRAGRMTVVCPSRAQSQSKFIILLSHAPPSCSAATFVSLSPNTNNTFYLSLFQPYSRIMTK